MRALSTLILMTFATVAAASDFDGTKALDCTAEKGHDCLPTENNCSRIKPESKEPVVFRIDAANKEAKSPFRTASIPIVTSSTNDESLLLLEREMQKYRVQVRKEFAAAPPVRAIGNQIQQVLLNLMTNARQAMASGGELVVRIVHDAKAGFVDLTVRDSGCGIPREQLPKIFDRGFTTKSGPDATGKGGTGVGLSACREIVEAHQGRLRVESSVMRGISVAHAKRVSRWPSRERGTCPSRIQTRPPGRSTRRYSWKVPTRSET